MVKSGISFRERLKKVIIPHESWNSQELHLRGNLFFRMEGDGFREWKDGGRTLEEQLPDILARLELAAESMKIAEQEMAK